MRKERVFVFWSAGGLAGGLLAATVWAQAPVPPTGPAPKVVREARGPVRRAVSHTWRVLQDNFIGYPAEFVEPPPGFFVYEAIGVMKSKADPHTFTLYRSDFLDGTTLFSTVGAGRFNLMASRLRGWPGPVLIEWSPEQPALAEARRAAVVGMLRGTGQPFLAERVVIAPSSFPGMLGTDAALDYDVMIYRGQMAPRAYSLTPTAGATFGSSGGAP